MQPQMMQPMMANSSLQNTTAKARNPNPSPAKIFVGGLPDMSTEELVEYFTNFGNVIDAIVMRTNTGRPRGFGFITFDDLAVREHVMSLQHTIMGKDVELRPADGKEASSPRSGGPVRGLGATGSAQRFSPYQPVMAVKMNGGGGMMRSQATPMQMQSQGSLQLNPVPAKILQPQMQQPQLMMQPQMMQPMMANSSLQNTTAKARNPNPSPAKIFVGGLPDMSTEELVEYFTAFGSVVDAIVMRTATGRPRGFGFVTFDDLAVREQVMSLQHTIMGKDVELRPADGKQ